MIDFLADFIPKGDGYAFGIFGRYCLEVKMKSLSIKRTTLIILCLAIFGTAGGAAAQTNISNSPNWFSSCPRIAVDSAGNVHAVWAEFYTMSFNWPQSGDCFYSKYTVATQQWSTPVNLSNSGQCYSGEWYSVGIDADASGNVYVVYIDRPKIKLRILSGGSWGAPFEVGSSPSTDIDSARVAVDAAGNIFVSWCDSGYRIVYSRARVGGAWEGAATLTYPGTFSKFPEISVGTNQVYCVFMDNHFTPTFYTAVYVRRAKAFGSAWSSSQRMTNADNWEEHPAVRVDANDVAHVVYTPYYDYNASRDVRYVESTSSGFTAPVVLGTEGNVHYPSLAVRGTNVFACWQSAGVHYRNRVGGAWAAENVVPNSWCYALTDVAASAFQDKLYYVWDTSSGEILFTELPGPGPYYSYKLKNDFNRDGHEDVLWRYYGAEGYNVVWYLGNSGSGLASLEGPILNKPAGEYNPMDTPQRTPPQVFLDPREAGRLMSEKTPQEVFWDARDAGAMSERGGREFHKASGRTVAPVISGAGELKGAGENGLPIIRTAGLIWTGTDWLPEVKDSNWKIEGTGDFNGDGKVDILWRYYGAGLGYNVIWYMDGVTVIGTGWLPEVVDTNWQIAGVGDFTKDGKVDYILWRYYGPGGYNVVWAINGTQLLGWQYLPDVADTKWKIGGTGDFNRDGKDDILWRYQGTGFGYNVVWYMDGITMTGIGMLPEVADANWEIAGTGDFNEDGKVDILWRYYGAGFGYNVVWYMNGITLAGWEYLPAVPDTNWRIENH